MSLWDNLKPMYNVTDTAALLGCSVSRVRKYLKFGMLQELRLGRRKMIDSKSIKKVYEVYTKLSLVGDSLLTRHEGYI